ncbi:hypothetical protein AAU61_01155 [Desulfocarbo indianensis]|nr:hypothetical protein AAU61_01155 [Desulfocarbo indianensis]
MAHWLSAIDGYFYDNNALELLRYWTDGNTALGKDLVVARFILPLAWLYRLIYPHALTAVAFNALCLGAAALFAHRLCALAGRSPRACRWLALVVVFWPPLFAWSSLPLKESSCVLAIFCLLACLLGMLRGHPKGWIAPCLALSAIGLSVFYLIFVRFYFASFLPWACLAPSLAAVIAGLRGNGAPWARALLVNAVLFMALLAAAPYHREFNLVYKVGGQDPKAHHGQPEAGKRKYGPELLSKALPDAKSIQEQRQRFVQREGRSLSGTAQKEAEAMEKSFSQPKPGLQRLLFVQAPEAFIDLFFFPYPWQRWPARSSWGPVNLTVSAWGILIYFLLPGLFAGMYTAFRRQPVVAVGILFWALALGMAMGLVVVNRGTLFRVRDLALLPLCVLFEPGLYAAACKRISAIIRKLGNH